MSVDDAIKRICTRGQRTLMVKLDIENAYSIIPVHLTDRLLLGMVWKGELYLDSAFRFAFDRHPRYLTVWHMHSSGLWNPKGLI